MPGKVLNMFQTVVICNLCLLSKVIFIPDLYRYDVKSPMALICNPCLLNLGFLIPFLRI
jgi:hypothetical protein